MYQTALAPFGSGFCGNSPGTALGLSHQQLLRTVARLHMNDEVEDQRITKGLAMGSVDVLIHTVLVRV